MLQRNLESRMSAPIERWWLCFDRRSIDVELNPIYSFDKQSLYRVERTLMRLLDHVHAPRLTIRFARPGHLGLGLLRVIKRVVKMAEAKHGRVTLVTNDEYVWSVLSRSLAD